MAEIGNKTRGGRRFQKGNPGGPGRPKGARDRAWLVQIALESMDRVGGAKYLEKLSQSNPSAYMAYMGKVIPAESKNTNENVTLTWEQALDRYRAACDTVDGAGVEKAASDGLKGDGSQGV